MCSYLKHKRSIYSICDRTRTEDPVDLKIVDNLESFKHMAAFQMHRG